MKTRTILLFLSVSFLSSSWLTAQEKTIWFDANWNVSTKSKAVYYRPNPKPKDAGYWVVDYYMNGTVQMEGFSYQKEAENEKFEGLVKYYFETGKINQEINYKAGVINGDRKIYYESGKLKNERIYENGQMSGKFSEYYETGELKERGKYENNLKAGLWKLFYKNGKIKEKGKYEAGKKIGVWKTYFKNVYK